MGYTLIFIISSMILFGLGSSLLQRSIIHKDRQLIREKINTYSSIAERRGLPRRAVSTLAPCSRSSNPIRVTSTSGSSGMQELSAPPLWGAA